MHNSNNELTHWGIKGQKWGVRRYQKKDGSLTSAGKNRYRQKSKHRLLLEQKYRDQGMSKKDAEAAATKRIKTEKILAAASVMTVTAATAYALNKKRKDKIDGVIKAGKVLQRVEMSDAGKLHDSFYAAKDRTDKIKYAGALGATRKVQTGKAFVMDIGVNKDIKIAGRDKATKVFKDLYDNDLDFRIAAKEYTMQNVHGKNFANGNTKKMYDNFNSALIDRDNPAVKKFYEALKSEGYGAVRDVNDMKFSGYKAKNPLIVFGQKDNVSVKSFRELSDSDIGKNLLKIGAMETNKALVKMGTVAVPTITVKTYINDYKKSDTTKKNIKGR